MVQRIEEVKKQQQQLKVVQRIEEVKKQLKVVQRIEEVKKTNNNLKWYRGLKRHGELKQNRGAMYIFCWTGIE